MPFVYPVLASVLDTFGGLPLVRGFSLHCVLATTISVYRALADLGYPRERLLAAVVFALAGLIAAAILGGTWLAWSKEIAAGIAFTTAGRTALSPHPTGELVAWLTLDIGILILSALIGGLLLARCGPAHAMLSLGLLCGGMALPVGQLILGEGVAFGKHMAYSALFLAPLAGYALAHVSRGTWTLLPV